MSMRDASAERGSREKDKASPYLRANQRKQKGVRKSEAGKREKNKREKKNSGRCHVDAQFSKLQSAKQTNQIEKTNANTNERTTKMGSSRKRLGK